ncbi:hypothetical protein Daus18300_009126 [Diaporthe australafricana]|uniref:Uncharacterized protein n=1 Tax=Diaporthe australafricana TaxID=127596 RepID=A0ABR3WFG4_9PEZI
MASAQDSTFAQWAQQTYGPTITRRTNAHAHDGFSSDIVFLVALKRAGQLSALNQVHTPNQSAILSSSQSTISSPNKDVQSPTSAQNTTQKTTPESTDLTPPEAATLTFPRTWMKRTDPIIQKDSIKPEPEQPKLEVDWRIWYPDPIAVDKWVRSLSTFDRLEHFVYIKIKTFRDHVKVHIPLYCRQWQIDKEEDMRRRKFFEKHGPAAFEAQYINSNYVGHTEFLLCDPSETAWLE